MTEAEARACVVSWAARLCPEWDVDVKTGNHESKPDALASVIPSDDYLHATVYLGEVIGDRHTERESEALVIHELLHLVFHDLEGTAQRATWELANQAGVLMRREIDHHLERTIERCAYALVDA